MRRARLAFALSLQIAVIFGIEGCSSEPSAPGSGGSGGSGGATTGSGGSGGATTTGSGGSGGATTGSGGSGGATTGSGGSGGATTTGSGGSGGATTTGSGGSGGATTGGRAGSAGSSAGGSAGASTGGSGGSAGGSQDGGGAAGTTGSGGSAGTSVDSGGGGAGGVADASGGKDGGGGSFSPLCSNVPLTAAGEVPTKGGVCTPTDTQLCYKTCGPLSIGFKSETCTGGVYVEQSDCSFPPGDYACYKIPAAISATCPTTTPQASQPCAVAECTLCNVAGNYLDSTGAAKLGYCVCPPGPDSGTARKWSCASTTAWPCPGGQGC